MVRSQHWDLTPEDEMRAREAQGSLVHLGSEHPISVFGFSWR